MDGLANSHIGAATADHAGHVVIDVLIGGLGVALEEVGRRHDLPGLAVAALGNVQLEPGFLYRVELAVCCCKAFNCCYRTTFNGGYG